MKAFGGKNFAKDWVEAAAFFTSEVRERKKLFQALEVSLQTFFLLGARWDGSRNWLGKAVVIWLTKIDFASR